MQIQYKWIPCFSLFIAGGVSKKSAEGMEDLFSAKAFTKCNMHNYTSFNKLQVNFWVWGAMRQQRGLQQAVLLVADL